MAHRYLLTAHVHTRDEAEALRVADALGELVHDSSSVVLDREAAPMAETGVVAVYVTFVAESDSDADELRAAVSRLEGLPPVTDPATRVLKRNV